MTEEIKWYKKLFHVFGFHYWMKWSEPKKITDASMVVEQGRYCLICNKYSQRLE